MTYHHFMRRWMIRIVLLLVIGAVINITVAWWLAIRPDPVELSGSSSFPRWSTVMKIRRDVPPLGVMLDFVYERNFATCAGEIQIVESNWPGVNFHQIVLAPDELVDLLPKWSKLHEGSVVEGWSKQTCWYIESATGWPMLSLVGRRWLIDDRSVPGNQLRIDSMGVLTLPSEWIQSLPIETRDFLRVRSRNTLPLIPIWPGFYVNMLLYAFVAWFVFFAPFTLLRFTKRARRRRKGLCLRCGYDLRGATSRASGGACPECGALSEPRP